jgi:hypothetical protein
LGNGLLEEAGILLLRILKLLLIASHLVADSLVSLTISEDSLKLLRGLGGRSLSAGLELTGVRVAD